MLETNDDVIDKMVYTLVNPVTAGLVARAAKWPGLTSVKHHVGDTITAERPEIFFRPDGPMPLDAELELARPPGFDKLTDEQFEELLIEQLQQKEDEVRTRFKLEGRRFLGVHAIRKIRPFDSPRSREPRRKLNPRIACKDTGLRVAAIDPAQGLPERLPRGIREVEGWQQTSRLPPRHVPAPRPGRRPLQGPVSYAA